MEVVENVYKVVKTNLFDVDFILKSLVAVTLLSYALGALFTSYTGQINSQTIGLFVED